MPEFIQTAWTWFITLELTDQIGVVTGLMGAGGFTIFGWMKWFKPQEAQPEKETALAIDTNTGIQSQGNLSIASSGSGTTQVNTGTQIHHYISAEVLSELKRLGIAEYALNNFFHILSDAQIPAEDWDYRLRQIAEDYLRLKQHTAEIKTNSVQGASLKAQAAQALEQGEFDQAENLFQQIRDLNMDIVKQNILFAAEADAANGALAHTRFQYVKSGEYYERAAQALLALGKEHEIQAAEYLGWAGRGFHAGGKCTQALPLYEHALRIGENALDNDHPDIAVILNNLAGLHESMGEYAKALPLYERALAISENTLGNDHPNVATTLNNLAGLHESLGEYAKALPLYERDLAISENILGNDHPNVATTLNNLALLYQAQGDYAKALPLYGRTLRILEKALGNDHPNVATTLNNLGGLHYHTKDYSLAVHYLKRALAIRELKLGREHLDTKSANDNLDAVLEKLKPQ